MAHWDDERFNTTEPPKDIMCATCKFRLPPVTVAGYVQDRSGYSMCDKFTRKPDDILWEHALCTEYEVE